MSGDSRPRSARSFWRTGPLVLAVPVAALLAWGFIAALRPPRGAEVPAAASPAPPPRRPGEYLLLALGDSLTRGTGAAAGSGYVDDAAQELRAKHPGFRLENLAIDGLESTGLRDILSHPEPRRLAAAADAIFLSIGGNDLAHSVGRARSDAPLEALGRARREFESNLDAILSGLRSANPSGRIVLLLLYNPFGADAELSAAGSPTIIDWNAAAAKIALTHEVRAVPTFDLFEGHPERLSRDHYHPNEEGYRLIAERVKQAL